MCYVDGSFDAKVFQLTYIKLDYIFSKWSLINVIDVVYCGTSGQTQSFHWRFLEGEEFISLIA